MERFKWLKWIPKKKKKKKGSADAEKENTAVTSKSIANAPQATPTTGANRRSLEVKGTSSRNNIANNNPPAPRKLSEKSKSALTLPGRATNGDQDLKGTTSPPQARSKKDDLRGMPARSASMRRHTTTGTAGPGEKRDKINGDAPRKDRGGKGDGKKITNQFYYEQQKRMQHDHKQNNFVHNNRYTGHHAESNTEHLSQTPNTGIWRKKIKEGWQLLETIYENDVTEVKLVMHPDYGRVVAKLKDSSAREHEGMVMRKLTALAKEQNFRGIVQLLATEDADGDKVFIIMEHVDVGPRRRFIPENKRELRLYVRKLVEAIQFCHRNGVVHGDLKPSNALWDHVEERVKLIDFDLSVLVNSTTELFRNRGGTTGYKAPEQFWRQVERQRREKQRRLEKETRYKEEKEREREKERIREREREREREWEREREREREEKDREDYLEEREQDEKKPQRQMEKRDSYSDHNGDKVTEGDSSEGDASEEEEDSDDLDRREDKENRGKEKDRGTRDKRDREREKQKEREREKEKERERKLKPKTCTAAIDMWSIGIVVLNLMCGAYPKTQEGALRLSRAQNEQELARLLERRPKLLSKKGLDFVANLVRTDPTHRLTAEEALQHPFIRLRSNKPKPSLEVLGAKNADRNRDRDRYQERDTSEEDARKRESDGY